MRFAWFVLGGVVAAAALLEVRRRKITSLVG